MDTAHPNPLYIKENGMDNLTYGDTRAVTYNLAKLFRMKLKTAILQKKNLMNLLADPAFIVVIV